jgi:hypothetical protein
LEIIDEYETFYIRVYWILKFLFFNFWTIYMIYSLGEHFLYFLVHFCGKESYELKERKFIWNLK